MRKFIATLLIIFGGFFTVNTINVGVAEASLSGCWTTYVWRNGIRSGGYSYCSSGTGNHRIYLRCYYPGGWSGNQPGPWVGAGKTSLMDCLNGGTATSKTIQYLGG